MSSPGDITVMLQDAAAGRAGAMDRLMERVYADLERIALAQLSQHFGRRANTLTIEPAALVNESFLRLVKQRKAYDNRHQFFAIATKLMLRVLLDYQRSQAAARRGGEAQRVRLSLDGRPGPDPGGSRAEVDLEPLVSALQRLTELDPRQADVVKMRVIWGLEVNEIADALALSASTVKRDWRFARAWLMEEASRA